ncbi:MAG: hypothetical protein Q8Q49_03400 [bacterium]|nr:hypothetical protein [bacterium]
MSSPDNLEQNVRSQPDEFQAPNGTYDFLAYLEGGRLGNARTKHLIQVSAGEGDFSVDVQVRTLDQRPYLFPHTIYNFSIDSDDKVNGMRGRKAESRREQGLTLPVNDLVFEEAIAEIGSARRLASTRRR